MIRCECYDVEVLPNFFSITYVDLASFLETFKDCVNDKSEPIPMIQKLTVNEIKNRLANIKRKSFYITDKDDSQLFKMVEYINGYPILYIPLSLNKLDDVKHLFAVKDKLFKAITYINNKRIYGQ